jgi:hypothetical protein
MRVAGLCLGVLLCLAGCGGGGNNAPGDGPAGADAPAVGDAACEYPQQTPPDAGNDPDCPAQYGGPSGGLCTPPGQSCTVANLTCRYYGVGDGRPGCYAIAMMWCNPAVGADGGTVLKWVCAN